MISLGLGLLGLWGLAALLMALLWWRQTHTRRADMVDVVWAAAVSVGAWGVCAVTLPRPWGPRAYLALGLVLFWSSRLTTHLLQRVRREAEDGRYRWMRQQAGEKADRVFLAFFQVQAFWVALFAAPVVIAASRPGPLGILDGVGVAVGLVALAMEAWADRQLARFRRDPENRGRVCEVGWWGWSRHPNYFFEGAFWLSFGFLAASGPHAWVAWGACPMMYVFLYRVTGIPWTEQQALRTRGDAYRDYQRRVPSLIPWPRF